MSEEQANEQAIEEVFTEFDEVTDEAEAVDEVKTDESEDKAEVAETPEYSPLELEAREDGHTTKSEWEAAGKDPERWKSPHAFVEYGKIKGALDKTKADQDKMRVDFDKRLENVNKIHQAETKAKLTALKAEQRKAVEEADTDAYDEAQTKIEAIKEEVKEDKPEVKASEVPQEIQEWEAKNDWINDPQDPRAMMAQGLYNGYVQNNPNGSPKELIAYVNKQMKLDEAPTNPRRDAPSETGRSPVATKSTGKVSMADLTQEEQALWRNAGEELWDGDKKMFLQSVKDSRMGL